MKQLVRLWQRPCKKGRGFKYVLLWKDEEGKQNWQNLGHTDARKAERQRIQKEHEFRMGIVESVSMKLSELLEDYVVRTRGQVRDSTIAAYSISMKHFIRIIGDIDCASIKHTHGERFIHTDQQRESRAFQETPDQVRAVPG